MGNYQLADKLTFYCSYPLYAYASGMLNEITSTTDLSEEELFNLISLNPSKISSFTNELDGDIIFTLSQKIQPDFFMTLGHNFAETNQNISLFADGDELSTSQVVNSNIDGDCDYNGWSLASISGGSEFEEMKLRFNNGAENMIGSVLWGKKWIAPQNVDVNQTLKVSYGYKAKKSVSGKTISTLNYSKTGKWLLDAWELDANASDTRNEPTNSRNGIRTWNVNFSFLQDSKMMAQNNMLNSNNWTQDSQSEYSTGADDSSLYDTNNSTDFYTSVIKMTMGGHLPLVINISDSTNSDQWAIVRISDYQVTQTNPKFINYKLTLEEQV
jgi:hypothetical protein